MDKKYKGMTVNERLYVSNYLEDFDKAVKDKNIKAIIEILKKVEITDDISIDAIIKHFGLFDNDCEII